MNGKLFTEHALPWKIESAPGSSSNLFIITNDINLLVLELITKQDAELIINAIEHYATSGLIPDYAGMEAEKDES